MTQEEKDQKIEEAKKALAEAEALEVE